MKIKAWAILTTGLADGYELTKSPSRVQAARENGHTVVELVEKVEEDAIIVSADESKVLNDWLNGRSRIDISRGMTLVDEENT